MRVQRRRPWPSVWSVMGIGLLGSAMLLASYISPTIITVSGFSGNWIVGSRSSAWA